MFRVPIVARAEASGVAHIESEGSLMITWTAEAGVGMRYDDSVGRLQSDADSIVCEFPGLMESNMSLLLGESNGRATVVGADAVRINGPFRRGDVLPGGKFSVSVVRADYWPKK